MMQRITSRQNPLVARFREVASGESADLLLLDGTHLVSEALAAHIRVRQAVVSSDALERPDILAILEEIARQGIDVAAASAPVMDAISPVRSASQLVAIGERPAHDSGRMYGEGSTFLVLTADVQDPGNIGAIVRVAEASGASGVIAAGISANPFGWKALRGSMGSALRLPVGIDPDTAHAADEARRRGYRLVATVPRGGQSFVDADLRGRVVIVVGGEGPGISRDILDATDVRVTIPMEAPVESLNAAVAAAVLLYEARRQREVRK
jgi:TrmH family RNA methyltransferase